MNDLLERATRVLPTVDLVDAAVRRADRTRRRRRAGIAGAAAIAVAVAVGISAVVLPRSPDAVPTQHVPAPKTFRVPTLRASIIQPDLDLATALDTPAEVGLPTSLTPHDAVDTPPDRALMVTKERRGDQHVFYALDTSMRWHKLTVDAPADIGNGLGPMLDPDALSPDGTKVALRGAEFTYVVDLATGQTSGRRPSRGSTAHWVGDHTLTIVKDFRTQQTSAGDTVIRSGPSGFTEWVDGSVRLRAKTPVRDDIAGQGLRAMPGRLAMVASPMFSGRKHAPDSGILVLDRPSYRGIAFLPLPVSHEQVALAPPTGEARGWLDKDTLLFSVSPEFDHRGTVTSPREYYLTFDLRTGKVSHVATVDQFWRDSSWARELLAR